MKTKVKLYCIAFLSLSFFTCEQTIEWELQNDGDERLVVDALLHDQEEIQCIRISAVYDDINGSGTEIQDASVIVIANTKRYIFEETPGSPGLYKSIEAFGLINNIDYSLEIEHGGSFYTARSRIAPVAPIPTLNFSPFGQSDSLTLDELPRFNNNQQALYIIEIDWTHLSNQNDARAKLVYFTFSTIDLEEFLQPQSQEVAFPIGSVVFINKYGINDEFASYLRATALETDWEGGFFGSQSDTPIGNIEGALGFFGTCSLLRDTIIAQ